MDIIPALLNLGLIVLVTYIFSVKFRRIEDRIDDEIAYVKRECENNKENWWEHKHELMDLRKYLELEYEFQPRRKLGKAPTVATNE